MERLARAMCLKCTNGYASAVALAIRNMSHVIGLPSGLKAIGVEETLYPEIVQGALVDHCHKTNPRLASEIDYFAILKASA